MECPKCSFSDHMEDALFCEECGVMLFNYCSNDSCENNDDDNLVRLKPTARFCPHCGEKSTFFTDGLIDMK